jgi:hypothetical protein
MRAINLNLFQKLVTLLLLSAISAAAAAANAAADSFELSGKAYRTTWPNHDWTGKYQFPGVYCLTYPTPESAIDAVEGMFKGGAIHLMNVDYPAGVSLVIVASTIPGNRSADEEVARLAAHQRDIEKQVGQDFHVTQSQTDFGPSYGFTVRNVVDTTSNGPYPLVFGFSKPPDGLIHTVGVHRVFVRGPDRFEIAVLQRLASPVAFGSDDVAVNRGAQIADATLKSLQSCTGQLPQRVATPPS